MKPLFLAVLLPLFCAAPLYAAEAGVSVRLAEVKGAVSARASSSAEWVAVKEGAMLAPGGEVRTDPGANVVLAFSDGNKVKLEQKTTFGVEAATTLKTSLRLFSGKITAWVQRANRADFSVRHKAGVAAVRGTIFGMDGTEAALEIALYLGVLDITDNFGRPSTLSPGQNARVSQEAGLMGISSLPAGTTAPPEPAVAAPPPPGTTTAAPAPAETVPADTTADGGTTEAPPPSVTQESATTSSTCVATVSPSAPCP